VDSIPTSQTAWLPSTRVHSSERQPGQQCAAHLQATLAVCCTESGEFGKPRDGSAEHALVFWNLKDAFQPESVLTSTAALLSFDINALNPTLVVAGCADGQVVVWEQPAVKVRSNDQVCAMWKLVGVCVRCAHTPLSSGVQSAEQLVILRRFVPEKTAHPCWALCWRSVPEMG
jgi:hypothetical protein